MRGEVGALHREGLGSTEIGGEVRTKRMLELERMKSDGRGRLIKRELPRGIWSGSAADLRKGRKCRPFCKKQHLFCQN